MTFPSWLGTDGTRLVVDELNHTPLSDFIAVVAPAVVEPIPVVVIDPTVAAGGGQAFAGSGSLWGDDNCRFVIRSDGSGAPVAMTVYKPVALASGIELPGIDHDVFWMILEADTEAEDGAIQLPDGSIIPVLARQLFGIVEIGGVGQYLRLLFQGDDLIAEVDFTGDLSEIEQQILADEAARSGNIIDEVKPLDLLHIAPMLGTDHDPHGDLRWLPEPLRKPDLFTLDRFGFTVSPDGAEKILDASVTFGIAESSHWTPIPGFPYLTVGNAAVGLGVRHPLDGHRRRPHLTLTGAIGLGDATIRIQTRWPDLAIRGELIDPDDHPLTLSQLMALVHLPPLEHGPQVDRLTVDARPTGAAKSLSLRTSVGDVFSIPVGGSSIDLQRLTVALDLAGNKDSAERSLDAEIAAQLLIGTVTLLADAATVHGSDGWQFTARLGATPINVGAVETWIGDRFGAHTLPDNLIADGVDITDLEFGYQTATGDTVFRIVTDFQLSQSSAATGQLELDFRLSHQGGDHYQRIIEGRFTLGDYSFDLIDATDGAAAGSGTGTEMLIGTFRHEGPVTVGDLLAAAGLPLPIAVDLTDAVIGHSAGATLCLVDMAAGFDLARLPLVGPMLTGNTKLGFALRVLAATANAWDSDLVGTFNQHLDSSVDPLIEPEQGQSIAPAGLLATVTIAGEAVHLPSLGVDLKPAAKTAGSGSVTPSNTGPPAVPVEPEANADSGVTWVPIQRSLGPVHGRRLGVHLDTDAPDPTIELLLDADVTLGGFTLSLEGLGVKSPLDKIDPTFSLKGLGLDVTSDAYEIGGMFLRTGPEEFAGAATVRTPTFTLSAIGAYGKAAGHPSVFLYAVLDYPLGGPSFFFVTGLAAGFGYNRKLTMPGPDAIAEFPLVADAVAGASNAELPTAAGIAAKLANLESYLPPSYGDLFFAIGVKFNSFKLIDSFVLAAVSIGDGGSDVRIDVLGLSTMVLPSPETATAVDPLAEIQIALHAQILPTEGFVGVDARLTSASYALSRNCHLRGGAAFYAWFGGDNAGDFVATLGGYHPHFRPPTYYPTVPRLSFDWHVSRELMVKGAMYCALTPNALMAGGSLEATYTDGAIHAWFRTGCDFLLSWQPYYYDASMYISVGARWHFLHGEFGVSLRVWGPDFAGTGEVDLGLSSFTVEFGSHKAKVTTVPWSTFRDSALPHADAVCGVICQRGLIRQLDPDAGLDAEWVVSSHDLAIEVSSQIPASTVTFNADSTTSGVVPRSVDTSNGHPALGVGPVGLNRGKLNSTVDITVRRVSGQNLGDHVALRSRLVTKSVPAAMWGDYSSGKPDPNGARVIDDALVGHVLRPEQRATPGVSGPFAKDTFGWHHIDVNRSAPGWTTTMMVVDGQGDPTPPDESARARAGLLTGLGIDPGEIRPGGDVAAALLATPIPGRFTLPPESS